MGREVIRFLKQKHGRNIPVISIRVGMSQTEEHALYKAGIKFARQEPILVDALVDTGALRSFVPRDFVQRLNLFPLGRASVSQPLAKTIPVELYAISIELVVGKSRGAAGWRTVGLAPTVQAGVLPNRGEGSRHFPMPIIGRDVLSMCRFYYNGPEEQIELELPRAKRRGFLRR